MVRNVGNLGVLVNEERPDTNRKPKFVERGVAVHTRHNHQVARTLRAHIGFDASVLCIFHILASRHAGHLGISWWQQLPLLVPKEKHVVRVRVKVHRGTSLLATHEQLMFDVPVKHRAHLLVRRVVIVMVPCRDQILPFSLLKTLAAWRHYHRDGLVIPLSPGHRITLDGAICPILQ